MYAGLNIGGLGSQPLPKRDTKQGYGYAKWMPGFLSTFEIKFPWGGNGAVGTPFVIRNQAGTAVFAFNTISNNNGQLLIGGSTFGANPTLNGNTISVNISSGSNQTMDVQATPFSGTSTPFVGLRLVNSTNTRSAGQFYAVQISQTYNQTSTAANTDLYINRTETAVGSGAQLLVDFAVAGTSKFSVSNTGVVVTQNVVRLKGFLVSTLPAGTQGDTAFCTDLLAPTYLAAAVGGGAIVGTVFHNGTAWVTG